MLVTNHDLPASYTREIGRIITKWSYLENYLQSIIYIMLGVNDIVGRVAIREPRVADKINVIEEIAYLRDFSLNKSTFKDTKKQINDMAFWRNLFAHSTWVHIPSKGWLVRATTGTLSPEAKAEGFAQKRRITPEGIGIDVEFLKKVVWNIDTIIQNLKEMQIALTELIEEQLAQSSERPPDEDR